MKVEETKGDLFENILPGDAIAHGVNCFGAMGAGIAVPIKNYYPNNYLTYNLHCRGKLLKPGQILPYFENDVLVFNLATQFHPGPDAQYAHVVNSVQAMYDFCQNAHFPVVKMPKIGCGIGGLDWPVVRALIEETGLDDVSVEVFYL